MNEDSVEKELTQEELQFIREAAHFFENPGLLSKSLNWVGRPIEYVQDLLPAKIHSAIVRASRTAIEKALSLTIKTIPMGKSALSFAEATKKSKNSGLMHTTAAALVGGIGGFFGIAALPAELPIATLLMLRSIADIAQRYGNDPASVEARLECIYVFSLGGKTTQDDAMESAYYTSRIMFAEIIKNASAYIAAASAKDLLAAVESGAAPALVRFITEIAAQFEIRVTKKFLVQTTPILGAAGGAGINLLFADFFQNCARFHFGMKKLEQKRGYEVVRIAFEGARKPHAL